MSIRITPLTSEKVLEVSFGKVVCPDTYQYAHNPPKPIKGGLFCQEIFGPIKDYECACGKLKGRKHRGKTCLYCNVEILPAVSRKDRMGHIDLPLPVINNFCVPLISKITSLKKKEITKIKKGEIGCYFKESPFGNLVLVDGRQGLIKIDEGRFGPYSLYKIIEQVDSEESSKIGNLPIRSLLENGFFPYNLFLHKLLVIPPEHRPIIYHEEGFWSISTTNDLYIRILQRVVRVNSMLEFSAPSEILEKEACLLQKAVDDLIIQGSLDSKGKEIPGLLNNFKGKTGLIRGSYGKRVDYSGRSVITSGPTLKLDEIGLPKEMAFELFKPFILQDLMVTCDITFKEALELYRGTTPIRSRKAKYSCSSQQAKESLDRVGLWAKVLMNRPPTLHRYGVMC